MHSVPLASHTAQIKINIFKHAYQQCLGIYEYREIVHEASAHAHPCEHARGCMRACVLVLLSIYTRLAHTGVLPCGKESSVHVCEDADRCAHLDINVHVCMCVLLTVAETTDSPATYPTCTSAATRLAHTGVLWEESSHITSCAKVIMII